MNIHSARFNMVQQQVRTWDVLDPSILKIIEAVPREKFVPPQFRQLAFSDTFIPIGYDQFMLPPKMVGRILQALALNKQSHVLEIGTGTGYMTALLCHLAKNVVTAEIIPELASIAEKNLSEMKLRNFDLEIVDGIRGVSKFSPYNAIVLTGSVASLPKAFGEQLSIHGKLFAVIGQKPAMSGTLLTKVGKDQWTKQILFETVIPPLKNAPAATTFKF